MAKSVYELWREMCDIILTDGPLKETFIRILNEHGDAMRQEEREQCIDACKKYGINGIVKHTHASKGDGSDECRVCGQDLRSDIHFRIEGWR